MEDIPKRPERTVTKYATKREYVTAYSKGRYDYVSREAQQAINECTSDNEILVMEVSTGSGLRVWDVHKLSEQKFLELTRTTKK